MKPIPDTNPADLINEAASSLVAEQRSNASSIIRKVMLRQEILSRELKVLENKAFKHREKIENLQKRVDRLRGGEWAILADLEREIKESEKQQGQKSETAED